MLAQQDYHMDVYRPGIEEPIFEILVAKGTDVDDRLSHIGIEAILVAYGRNLVLQIDSEITGAPAQHGDEIHINGEFICLIDYEYEVTPATFDTIH